jgi:hypothetical protein
MEELFRVISYFLYQFYSLFPCYTFFLVEREYISKIKKVASINNLSVELGNSSYSIQFYASSKHLLNSVFIKVSDNLASFFNAYVLWVVVSDTLMDLTLITTIVHISRTPVF